MQALVNKLDGPRTLLVYETLAIMNRIRRSRHVPKDRNISKQIRLVRVSFGSPFASFSFKTSVML